MRKIIVKDFYNEVEKGNLRVSDKDNLLIWNYTDFCTHKKNWNPVTMMSRGLITTNKGIIIALPYPKFFNLGELLGVKLTLPTHLNYSIFEKMDGSLGISYPYKGKFHISTRGSLESHQAQWATEFLHKNYPNIDFKDGYTYLFEVIYKDRPDRLVVDYGDKSDLTLTGIMNIKTGKCASKQELIAEGKRLNFPIPTIYQGQSIDELVRIAEEDLTKDEEGYVLRYENGFRVKIKGKKYLEVHRAISNLTFLHFWRSMEGGKVSKEIMDTMVTIEELKDESLDMQKNIEDLHRNVKEKAQKLFEQIRIDGQTPKEFAQIVFQGNHGPYAHLAMNLFRKKEIDSSIKKMIRPKENVLPKI